MHVLTGLILAASMMLPLASSAQQTDEEFIAKNPATFTAINKNVFSHSCTSCHMQMSAKQPAEAGIDFMSYKTMTASNKSKTNPKHAPFIVPGDPDHSKLYLAVKSGDMPATESGAKGVPLDPVLIQNIYDWIKAGAKNN